MYEAGYDPAGEHREAQASRSLSDGYTYQVPTSLFCERLLETGIYQNCSSMLVFIPIDALSSDEAVLPIISNRRRSMRSFERLGLDALVD